MMKMCTVWTNKGIYVTSIFFVNYIHTVMLIGKVMTRLFLQVSESSKTIKVGSRKQTLHFEGENYHHYVIMTPDTTIIILSI